MLRFACMPCTLIATHELNQFTTAADEKMRRHLNAAQVIEIGVPLKSQLIGEKILHILAAVDTWRQADGMNHHQINGCIDWARAKVG